MCIEKIATATFNVVAFKMDKEVDLRGKNAEKRIGA
jgi:hypothetical protein